MKVGLAIYNILSNATAVTAYVSTRIYPNVAPKTTPFPFIVYDVDGDIPTDTKDGAATVDVNDVMVSCYADTYSQACSLADVIRTALDRQSGTFAGVEVQTIVYTGYNDIFDDNHEMGIYRKAIDFNIRQINS